MKLRALTIAAFAVCMATATAAHDGATGAVKERMDEMEKVGAALKQLALRSRSLQVSPDQARNAIATIRDVARRTPQLFEEQDLSAPSESRPEIWANWNDFVKLSNDLVAYTERLDRVVNDQEALGDEIKQMGEICSACHRRYRQ